MMICFSPKTGSFLKKIKRGDVSEVESFAREMAWGTLLAFWPSSGPIPSSSASSSLLPWAAVSRDSSRPAVSRRCNAEKGPDWALQPSELWLPRALYSFGLVLEAQDGASSFQAHCDFLMSRRHYFF
jgi:hypothetical protein